MRNRRTMFVAAGALLLAALVVRPPSADIRILTHEIDDMTPRRMQAAIDVGIFAVSVLVTWTSHRMRSGN